MVHIHRVFMNWKNRLAGLRHVVAFTLFLWILTALLWVPTAQALPNTSPLLATTAAASKRQAADTDRQSRSERQDRLQGQARSEQPERPAMPPDIQRVLDRGKLIVAVLGKDNPPFFVEQKGKLEGLDIDLARAISTQLGVDLEINRTPQTFDEVVDTVYQLKADLAVSKISRTLKRAKRVRFSAPYLRMRQGLLVNRLQLAEQTEGRSPTETIRGLNGSVGVIKGSSYVGFIKQKFPKASIVEYPSWPEIVDAVSKGEVLAAYRDELEIKKVVLSKPDAALQLQTIALTDTQDSLAIVLPWDSAHLLAFTDQYLDMMGAQYTVDSILADYGKYSSSPPKG